MFAYCRNNPVCRVDVSGCEDQDAYGMNEDVLEDKEILGDGGPSNAPGPIDATAPNNGYHNPSSGGLTFGSEDLLLEHFARHNPEFGNEFSSPKEYQDTANYVVQNGEYLYSKNAYIMFYGYQGKANYAFVGLTRDGSYITTFHLKHATQIFY